MGYKMRILGILITMLLSFTSCEDCYYVENGLHGMWQVLSVERLATGEKNMGQGKLYYMFQRTMVSLGYNDSLPESMPSYIAHFDVVEDSIGMGIFRHYSTGEGNNIDREVKVSLSSLRKFGIYEDFTMFHVERSKRKLILTSDSAHIVLRKY